MSESLDIEKIKTTLRKFSKERDWQQFHSPKNLVMALSVEVAELVEIFQWSNDGGTEVLKNPKLRSDIEEEIADVFNYLVKLVDLLGMDLEKASLDKIVKNAKKYPIEKARGESKKYNDFD
jgi:dCTP diphosphatase